MLRSIITTKVDTILYTHYACTMYLHHHFCVHFLHSTHLCVHPVHCDFCTPSLYLYNLYHLHYDLYPLCFALHLHYDLCPLFFTLHLHYIYTHSHSTSTTTSTLHSNVHIPPALQPLHSTVHLQQHLHPPQFTCTTASTPPIVHLSMP